MRSACVCARAVMKTRRPWSRQWATRRTSGESDAFFPFDDARRLHRAREVVVIARREVERLAAPSRRR